MKSPLPLLSERALGGGVNEGGGEREKMGGIDHVTDHVLIMFGVTH